MIRGAELKDGPEIAELIMIILKDMELPLVEELGHEEIVRLLIEAYPNPKYRYGYARGIVYEKEGEVAGVAFGYPDQDEAQIDLGFQEVLQANGYSPEKQLFGDPEVFPDEWYLDTLVTAPKYRGYGIGSALLEALPKFALAANKQSIALNVDLANPKAKKLYSSLGYEKVEELIISDHTYEHLKKNL